MLKRLAALALQWAWLGSWANFAFFWASGFVFRLGWRYFSLVFFRNGFARLYGRGVATDMPDELIAQGVLDHAGMHALQQLTAGKRVKGAAECRLAWQRKTQIKAAQATQLAVGLQAIH